MLTSPKVGVPFSFTGTPTKIEKCKLNIKIHLTPSNIEKIKNAPIEIKSNGVCEVGGTLNLTFNFTDIYFDNIDKTLRWIVDLLKSEFVYIHTADIIEIHKQSIIMKELFEEIIKVTSAHV